ncbi:MAG TPA: hypothetical protein VFH63_00440 [candidate division Zixibacteria bacterium]|nr:hypothetical protein [candidate division Zixibacteria bacterium]
MERRRESNWLSVAAFVLAANMVLAFAGAGSAPALAGGKGGGGRQDCWMTGGGSIFPAGGPVEYGGDPRITHGFVLHCVPRNSDNLQINDHGTGWNFHLATLTSAICIDDPAIEPNPPDATFDTFVGQGTGRCKNGFTGQEADCTAAWTFTDGGEPGGCVRDTAVIEVRDLNGNLLFSVSGVVDCGNHQAHSQ